MLLGNKIKSLRGEQGILQRQVAAYLEIDTPMFSKIERGDRRAKRSQVIQMAKYFKVDEKTMFVTTHGSFEASRTKRQVNALIFIS